MSEHEDSGVYETAELQELIKAIQAKSGDGVPLRLDPTENLSLRRLLRVGVVLKPEWEQELHGKDGLGARLGEVELRHSGACKIVEVVEILDGKDLPDGGRTKGLRNEHSDLMDEVAAHKKALCGHTLQDGTRIKGLKEWYSDQKAQAASRDRLFWAVITATVVAIVNLAFQAVQALG